MFFLGGRRGDTGKRRPAWRFGAPLGVAELARIEAAAAPFHTVEIDFDGDPADAILAELVRFPDIRAVPVGGRQELCAVPFADIVLQAQNPTRDQCDRIAEQLSARCGDIIDGFRVIGLEAPDFAPAKAVVWFGRGVFCPAAAPKARLEITGLDPARGGPAPATPMLGAGLEAGWHEGQRCLAFCFNKGDAPALAALDRVGGPNAGRLSGLVFEIDIREAGRPIRCRAFRKGAGGLVAAPIEFPEHDAQGLDFAARLSGGDWVKIGVDGAPLWLRKVDLSHARRPAPAGAATGGPILQVLGLLMPAARGPWSIASRKPSGWRVDFDHAGQLRCSELQSVGHTALNRLDRFGVYDHGARRYADGAETGERSYGIGGDRRVVETDIGFLRDCVMPRALMAFPWRPRSAIIVTRAAGAECQPLAEIPLGTAGTTMKWSLTAAAASPAEHAAAIRRGEGELSLDWINRAAKVEADGWLGLADFWLNATQLSIEFEGVAGGTPAPRLTIRARVAGRPSGNGRQGAEATTVEHDQHVVLGPFFARFADGRV